LPINVFIVYALIIRHYGTVVSHKKIFEWSKFVLNGNKKAHKESMN